MNKMENVRGCLLTVLIFFTFLVFLAVRHINININICCTRNRQMSLRVLCIAAAGVQNGLSV